MKITKNKLRTIVKSIIQEQRNYDYVDMEPQEPHEAEFDYDMNDGGLEDEDDVDVADAEACFEEQTGENPAGYSFDQGANHDIVASNPAAGAVYVYNKITRCWGIDDDEVGFSSGSWNSY